MSALHRLESKVDMSNDHDRTRRQGVHACTPSSQHETPAFNGLSRNVGTSNDAQLAGPAANSPSQDVIERQAAHFKAKSNLLSFSARRTLQWLFQFFAYEAPAPEQVPLSERSIHLESKRAPVDIGVPAAQESASSEWLLSLNVSVIRSLATAYFETFNRIYPIVDSDHCFEKVFGGVIWEGFGYDTKSCLLLAVLALGCWGQRAIGESGLGANNAEHGYDPYMAQFLEEDPPGLSFFNECRRRLGFLLGERSLQFCQLCHLLALYNAQLMRPLDEYAMTIQACNALYDLWPSELTGLDDYDVDLFRRVFWCSLIRETVLVDELELPSSKLGQLESEVALPKFVQYKPDRGRKRKEEMYHCHFLAQCALRRIMTSIRGELFHSQPSQKLAEELLQQITHWRQSMPPTIQADLESEIALSMEASETVAVSLLQARCSIARYHIGRPFLFKAISNPAAMTEQDLEMCKMAMQAAADWLWRIRPSFQIPSLMPLKFFICGQ